jgi:hypothetical protein
MFKLTKSFQSPLKISYISQCVEMNHNSLVFPSQLPQSSLSSSLFLCLPLSVLHASCPSFVPLVSCPVNSLLICMSNFCCRQHLGGIEAQFSDLGMGWRHRSGWGMNAWVSFVYLTMPAYKLTPSFLLANYFVVMEAGYLRAGSGINRLQLL